jgi:DNA polymerase-3 subunit alpha
MIGCHCHSDVSNLRLLDALNSVEELITTSYQMGYKGVAITDHESVSAHIKAIKTVREFKEKGKISQDFKLILGNECYLVDDLESVKDNYKSGETKFPHFLLLSTSKQGHEILRMLSSRAWSRSFYTGTMERVPTLKADLEELVKPNQGLIIGSSACLGSESSIHLLAIKEAEEKGFTEKAQYHREKLHEFVTWCIDVFGKDYFFLEIQPAYSHEQIYVNEKLVQMANYYGLKLIVTTDAHYARPEDRIIHKAFLNSKDGDRETELFYEACFIQRLDEIMKG